jgi:hypothetical protein
MSVSFAGVACASAGRIHSTIGAAETAAAVDARKRERDKRLIRNALRSNALRAFQILTWFKSSCAITGRTFDWQRLPGARTITGRTNDVRRSKITRKGPPQGTITPPLSS